MHQISSRGFEIELRFNRRFAANAELPEAFFAFEGAHQALDARAFAVTLFELWSLLFTVPVFKA